MRINNLNELLKELRLSIYCCKLLRALFREDFNFQFAMQREIINGI